MSTLQLENIQHILDDGTTSKVELNSGAQLVLTSTVTSPNFGIERNDGSGNVARVGMNVFGSSTNIEPRLAIGVGAAGSIPDASVFVSQSGRIGVGVSAPATKLEIDATSAGASGDGITIRNATTGDSSAGIYIKRGSTTATAIYTNPAFANLNTTILSDGAISFRTNNANRALLDSSGYFTLPYQPAFSATGFSAHRYMSDWHNVALSNWNYVDQSSSGAFNNSNGRFTAPVDGMYFFIYTSMFQNVDTNDFHNNLLKNGTTYVNSNNHAGGSSTNGHTWNDCTVNGAVYLVAGDYVTATSTGQSSSTCFLYGSSTSTKYSNFSGWLIG